MPNQTRRDFLRAAGIAGISASQVLAEGEASEIRPRSRIRVAQIRVYPKKGELKANHAKLMEILAEIERKKKVDVLVTPEGFLDGYVVTEKSVTKEDLPGYAIDPDNSA
ncbi:MAG: twin-arginine translocation signal domain-containing protein, partial [Planctomycetota bacterium]